MDKGSLSTASSLLALLVLTLIIEFLSWLFSPQSFCGVTERVRSVNCSRPFFRAGAYTESDNALRLKKRSGNARLESRASGTFTTTLLSYGTGLLFLVLSKKVDLLSKYPAA